MGKKQPEPGLGAFSQAVTIPVIVGGQAYEWRGTATFTPAGSETKRSLSGTGTFLPVGTPPPPPPLPVISGILDGFRVPVSRANAGSVVFITGSGLGASPGTVLFAGLKVIVTAWNEREIKAVLPPVAATTTAPLRVMLQAGSVALESAPFTVNFVDIPPPPPPPPPPGRVNVRDHGARGDGVSDDTQAMQAAINAAGPGSTVYWPPGIYLQRDQLKLNHKSNLTLKGEGPTSILRAQAGMNFYLGTGGEPGSGLVVQDLKLQGNPNATLAVNTGGIQVFGPNGTVIERVTFQDVTSAVYCAAPSKGTIVRDCSILGWGRICFFLNGGERIDRCQCVQTDPDRFGEKSSHGFYIHSGCDDAIIQDCRITGARKYAAQIYGEQVGTTTTNIVLRRLAIADCANGIIIASSQPTAAVAKNCTIEECTITGIYAGSSLAIKQGDGLKIRNNTINGNTGAAAGHSGMGCYVGWWAPYDNVPPGPSVTNSEIAGNRITGCDRGFSSLASNGGHFSGVSVHDNYFWGNRLNVDVDSSAAGAGVILLNNHLVAPPGAQQRSDAASLATSADLRPGEE